MASLVDLPPEILDIILDALREIEPAQKSFAGLSKTCRYLHQSVELALYRDVKWIRDNRTDEAPPIHLLLRTILNQPRLASHVQNIHLRGWHRSRTSRSVVDSDYDCVETQLLRKELASLGMRVRGPWAQGYEFGKTDYFLAMLLFKCGNIKSLDLDLHYGSNKSLISVLLKRYEMPQLKTVRYCEQKVAEADKEYWRIDSGMDIDHLSHLFGLKSVNKIHASGLSVQALTEMLPPDGSNFSLTSLTLNRADCSELDVEKLLLVTSNLKHLVWDRWLDCECLQTPVYPCNIITRAISHVKETIESLTLGVQFYATKTIDVTNPGNWSVQGRLGSMRDFPKLKHVQMPFALLMGWSKADIPNFKNQLPQHMTHLCLTDATYDMWSNELGVRLPMEHLAAYLGDTNSTPDLEAVKLRTKYTDWALGSECLQIERLCADRYLNWSIEQEEGAGAFRHWRELLSSEWGCSMG